MIKNDKILYDVEDYVLSMLRCYVSRYLENFVFSEIIYENLIVLDLKEKIKNDVENKIIL